MPLYEISGHVLKVGDRVKMNIEAIGQESLDGVEFTKSRKNYWRYMNQHPDEVYTITNVIRIISQREGISRHMLGNMSNRENIAYFLGILAGIAYMSRELYTTEMQDNQIASVCSQSETAEKILYCLYTTNGGHGMYPADLADKVGLTIEQLTEAMIPLLSCRAVAAVGTGSHTFYTVGRIGKRYRSKAVCGQAVKRDAENGDAE